MARAFVSSCEKYKQCVEIAAEAFEGVLQKINDVVSTRIGLKIRVRNAKSLGRVCMALYDMKHLSERRKDQGVAEGC